MRLLARKSKIRVRDSSHCRILSILRTSDQDFCQLNAAHLTKCLILVLIHFLIFVYLLHMIVKSTRPQFPFHRNYSFSVSSSCRRKTFSAPRGPYIHVIVVCDVDYKFDNFLLPLRALLSQTLAPNNISIILTRDSLLSSAFLEKRIQSQFRHSLQMLRISLKVHDCHGFSSESCILLFTKIHAQQLSRGLTDHFTMLLSIQGILEPVALEKLYLSISLRNGVHALRMQIFNISAIENVQGNVDGLLIHRRKLKTYSKSYLSVNVLPIFYSTLYLKSCSVAKIENQTMNMGGIWKPIICVLNVSRLLMDPLFTYLVPHKALESSWFSLDHLPRSAIPVHLYNEMSYFIWSIKMDRIDYVRPLEPKTSAAMNTRSSICGNSKKLSVLLITPSLQFIQRDRSLLVLAKAAIQRGWGVTIIITNHDWITDRMSDVGSVQELFIPAFRMTSDIFCLPLLGPIHQSMNLLRYIIETRTPTFILIFESSYGKAHVEYINSIIPSSVVANILDEDHKYDSAIWERGKSLYLRNFDIGFRSILYSATEEKDQQNENGQKNVVTCPGAFQEDSIPDHNSGLSQRVEERNIFQVPFLSVAVLYVHEKGDDYNLTHFLRIIRQISGNVQTVNRLHFIVTTYECKALHPHLKYLFEDFDNIQVYPCLNSTSTLRRILSVSDALLYLSIRKEPGIILFEAMAAGLLVIAEGRSVLISRRTGIPISLNDMMPDNAFRIVSVLKSISFDFGKFARRARNGQREVLKLFSSEKFSNCVLREMLRMRKSHGFVHFAKEHFSNENQYSANRNINQELRMVISQEILENADLLRNARREIQDSVTIGIKTYICDNSRQATNLKTLIQSIRTKYPTIGIILGNDGPYKIGQENFVSNDAHIYEVSLPNDSGISFGRNMIVNETNTDYIVLLDDDHVFNFATDLQKLFRAIEESDFQLIGGKVRNLPGIREHEESSISYPRFVGNITRVHDGNLSVCLWDENRGPGVHRMQSPLPVDVVHNFFIAEVDSLRRHPWRNELKVNEHMTFFFDAKSAGMNVGYLPSVFIDHAPRPNAPCYENKRMREEDYSRYLPFNEYAKPNRFQWDKDCGKRFPSYVLEHMERA